MPMPSIDTRRIVSGTSQPRRANGYSRTVFCSPDSSYCSACCRSNSSQSSKSQASFSQARRRSYNRFLTGGWAVAGQQCLDASFDTPVCWPSSSPAGARPGRETRSDRGSTQAGTQAGTDQLGADLRDTNRPGRHSCNRDSSACLSSSYATPKPRLFLV
jgi:hypothetical protein